MTAKTSEPTTGLARLREPFPPSQVGLLPRITCSDCSKAGSRCCNEHKKSRCNDCGNFITSRHIHLDYVGHGAVTDRLLEVDPGWTWEPLAFDEGSGMPTFVYDKGLNPIAFWIRLTVLGVTRLGVGTCPGNQFDAEKVLIGDALRNAAMRFGVALDLWVKGQGEDDERASATDERSGPERGQQQAQPSQNADPRISPTNAEALVATCEKRGLDVVEVVKLGTDGRTDDPAEVHKVEIPAVKQAMDKLAGDGNEPPYPDPDTGEVY